MTEQHKKTLPKKFLIFVGMGLLGVGAGFLLNNTVPMAIPGFTTIWFGLGMLAAYFLPAEKK